MALFLYNRKFLRYHLLYKNTLRYGCALRTKEIWLLKQPRFGARAPLNVNRIKCKKGALRHDQKVILQHTL